MAGGILPVGAVSLAGALSLPGALARALPRPGAAPARSAGRSAGCPHPSVPVPPNEPVYTAGRTELVAGLYVQGGAVPAPPCRPKPRGPYGGRLTVTTRQGRVVASQRVRDGHLAHIRLSPGTYELTGRFAHGGTTSYPVRVTVRCGKSVRQDAFLDVP